MTGQTKAGDIGHGICMGCQQRRGRALWPGHGRKRSGNAFTEQQVARHRTRQAGQRHVGGHDGARADRLGQDQHVAGPGPRLGDRAAGKAGDGEPHAQFRAHGGMAADDIGPGGAEHFGGGLQHLGQRPRLQGGRQAGQGDLRQRDLRRRRHRPDVAQRMGGGDAGHQARVVGEAAQMVGGDDLHPLAMAQLGGIIARPRDHIGPRRTRQHGKARRQPLRSDLGATAAAQRLPGQRLHQRRNCRARQGRGGHRRIIGEPRHELAVDPVLQPPQPAPRQAASPFVTQRRALAQ